MMERTSPGTKMRKVGAICLRPLLLEILDFPTSKVVIINLIKYSAPILGLSLASACAAAAGVEAYKHWTFRSRLICLPANHRPRFQHTHSSRSMWRGEFRKSPTDLPVRPLHRENVNRCRARFMDTRARNFPQHSLLTSGPKERKEALLNARSPAPKPRLIIPPNFLHVLVGGAFLP